MRPISHKFLIVGGRHAADIAGMARSHRAKKVPYLNRYISAAWRPPT